MSNPASCSTSAPISGSRSASSIALAVSVTIRWQRRWGGFWIYSVLLALFLVVVALGTYTESAGLSDASLEDRLRDWAPEISTIDELRPRMMARNNSLMLPATGGFLATSVALMILASSKARQLRGGASAVAGRG